LNKVVLDPVMIAKGGAQLINNSAIFWLRAN
jgi:hydroxymethylpyrimidine/phosphomethylpyrimidine kinase